MEPRDRIVNLGVAGRIGGRLDHRRHHRHDPRPVRGLHGRLHRRDRRSASPSASLAIPLCWLVVFARHRRIAYQGDWARAARRGGWVGLFVAALVILRLVDAFQLPILLFLAAIFIVAEVALSNER